MQAYVKNAIHKSRLTSPSVACMQYLFDLSWYLYPCKLVCRKCVLLLPVSIDAFSISWSWASSCWSSCWWMSVWEEFWTGRAPVCWMNCCRLHCLSSLFSSSTCSCLTWANTCKKNKVTQLPHNSKIPRIKIWPTYYCRCYFTNIKLLLYPLLNRFCNIFINGEAGGSPFCICVVYLLKSKDMLNYMD